MNWPNRQATRSRILSLAGATCALILLAGCHNDMWIQPKVRPYDPSDFFTNGQGMRQLPAHTVDRTHFWTDTARYLGYDGGKWVNDNYVGGKLVKELPIAITRDDILRGQERFNIYCTPCHGALGNGQGMIANRGFALRRQPGNYQTARLRKMPIGHFYDVITNGYGAMYSYAARVEPDDRWRIAAYIRVLQRSQQAKLTDVPDDKRDSLGTGSIPQPNTGEAGAAGTTSPPTTTGAQPDTNPGAGGATGTGTGASTNDGTNANGH